MTAKAVLKDQLGSSVEWSMDKKNGITSSVGRTVHEGRRAVVVGSDASAKTQLAGLMDLLDLHLSRVDPVPEVPDQVVMLLGGAAPEAHGALETLAQSLRERVVVELLERAGDEWRPLTPSGWEVGNLDEYKSWPGLLKGVTMPPPIVNHLVEAIGRAEVRAYPMLTTNGGWSLRVEGLEVAKVKTTGGTLGVGKDARSKDGSIAQSASRQAWIKFTGHDTAVPVQADPASIDNAAAIISGFASQWHQPATHKAGSQNEHALESRILRGAIPIEVDGTTLDLIRPNDGVVNWGSQFPTKWGHGGSARYLDALLRDGEVPWAIEMKIAGSAGLSQYYRHGVAQAVLYREFIKGAKDLHFWFDAQGLDAQACRGAVVVPTIGAKQAKWRDRLATLCDGFDVSFIEVDPASAQIAWQLAPAQTS